MSLVPRLNAISPLDRFNPASEDGLSPVNATSLHNGENPNRSTKYFEIFPIIVEDETGSARRKAKSGAQAC